MWPDTEDLIRNERGISPIPETVPGTAGAGRDPKLTGVYFRTDAAFAIGNGVDFDVTVDRPGGNLLLKFRGIVERVDGIQSEVGIAVRIVDSQAEVAPTGAR